jgi:hypothetical protein
MSEACKKAVNEFADAYAEGSENAKDFLNALQQSPVGRAAIEAGAAAGGAAAAFSPDYSGVADPLQKNLLTEALKGMGAEIFDEAILQDTGNQLNKIFHEAGEASMHLFEVGPKFFYTMIRRKSKELNRAIATATTSGAALLAESQAFNLFHQTCDRSDLDNFDANTARDARNKLLVAAREIDTASKNSNSQGNNALAPEKVVFAQRQATTVPGTILTVPTANFVAAGVRPGDVVSFVVVAERLAQSGSVLSTQRGFFDVVSVDSPTQLTLSQPLVFEANVEVKVSRPSGGKAAVNAMEAVCALLTNPTAIIAFLFMEQILKRIDDYNRSLQNVMRLKEEFEISFNNTLNANIINPTKRVFQTASSVLTGTAEKYTKLLGAPNFDKFTALNLLKDICMRISVLTEAFRRNQDGVKSEISVDQNYSTFNQAAVDVASETNGPATDYLTFSTSYRQVVQSIQVADVRPALAQRTTELAGHIASVSAWLAAQAAILIGLPVVTNALTTVATSLTEASGMDRMDSLLKSMDLTKLVNSSSNTATKAGNAAEELGICIEDLPVSQQAKASRLSKLRSDLISFERTQVISAEAVLTETPEAIDDVDSQAKQVAAIREEVENLL